jgi:RNA polymerase sigma-70 factor (ECF subfamily)
MAAHDTIGSETGETDGAGGGATGTTPQQVTPSVWTRFRSIFRAPTREDREFVAFHTKHAPLVWGILRRNLRSGPFEEIHQDAFIKAWRLENRGEAIKSPEGLLTRITINEIRNYKRWRGHAVEGGTSPGEPADKIDPEQEAIAAARKRVVEETIAKMPPGPREAFTLIELEGKTDQEVADLLGRPLGTVKSWKSKARALLAEAAQAHMRAEEGVDKK